MARSPLLALPLVLVLLLAAAATARADTEYLRDETRRIDDAVPVTCAACASAVTHIERALRRIDQTTFSSEGDAEATNARNAARRRRSLTHGRSETKIRDALGGACAFLRASEEREDEEKRAAMTRAGFDIAGACETIVETHEEDIEEHVFADGVDGLKDLVCVRLTRACPRLSTRDEL